MPNTRVIVGNLPLVLAGPLLRRVDPESTTVFLALREQCAVTLEVFEGEPGSGATSAQRGGCKTSRIAGSSLYLAAVTASGQLKPGTLYTYRVTLDTGAIQTTLLDPGAVAPTSKEAKSALTYPDGPSLPSFVTPPDNPGGLRLLHGSCRKPHGEGFDMLAAADAAVLGSIASPTTGPRPHQLLLTGDQIYADDVADALLAVAQQLAAALGLPTESMSGSANATPMPGPGDRQDTSNNVARFSSTEAKSHLFAFSEFAGAYLLAWSPTCWPTDLPTFRDVHPQATEKLGAAYDQVLAGTFTPAAFGFLRGRALELLLNYQGELAALGRYRAGLPAVRRVMANTPTFMIFDDHEITDDWNITLNWVRRALLPGAGGPFLFGRQVIRNGLCAYALFQAWGNTPKLFTTDTPGAALLEALEGWRGIEDINSRTIDQRVGLPTGTKQGVPTRPDNALTYHYSVQWSNYQLVCLDSRTYRVFPGGPDDPPALLYGDEAYEAMLTSAGDLGTDAVHVVIAPAPVFGVPLLEDIVQPLSGEAYRVIDYSTDGKLAADPESWSLNTRSFEKLLSRLATVSEPANGVRRRRVVLLSGDVHYGFAAGVRWSAVTPFDTQRGGPAEAAFAQLVASSCKNETGKTRFLHYNGYGGLHILKAKDRVGWSNLTAQDAPVASLTVQTMSGAVVIDLHPVGSPVMLDTIAELTVIRPHEWEWHARWLKHTTPPVGPGAPQVVKPTSGQQALQQYLNTAPIFGSYKSEWGAGKQVVGVNNLGDVTFVWPAGDTKQVFQTLWWQLPGQLAPSPLTRYAVDLSFETTP